MKKGAILIPAYEPDATLVRLVEALRPLGAHLVVVDDGSKTAAARAAFAALAGRVDALLVHGVNRGKGAALRTGFAWIRDHLPEAEVVVTADADGQHTPADIRRVAEAALAHPQGLVLGVRQFSGHVPLRSRFGNAWARFFFWLLTGLSLRDTQTGLRAVPRALLARVLALPGERYDYETRMLVDARRHAAKPLQVAIETVYLDGNRSSHFRPLRDTLLTQRALWAARAERRGGGAERGRGHAH